VFTRRGRDELKFVDGNFVGTATTAGAIQLLNGVTQGTDYNNRIGRKMLMKSIMCRFIVKLGTVDSPGQVIRLLIVYDAQTNAALPAVTDVLQTADVLSPMNLNNRDRFKILSDKWWSTGAFDQTAGALTAGEFCPAMEKFYKKINLEVNNSGTANTIGSIATGGVYAIVIGEVATNDFELYSRIRFTDS